MLEKLSSVRFQGIIEHYIVLAYIILFVGVIIEGEFFLILAGILTHMKVFKLDMVIPIIILASFVKTILWYQVGSAIKNKTKNRFTHYIQKKVLDIMPHFKEKPFWSIFISKFVYGLNHLVLVFSGMIDVHFKKYFLAEISASLFWLSVYFGLGYFFSHTAFSLTRNIRLGFLIIIGFIIILFIAQRVISVVIDLFGGYND